VVRVGPLPVRTAAAEVDGFADALGLTATCGSVPLTFPIRWLGLPELRGPIGQSLGLQNARLVHQSQSFTYHGPLERDRDYRIEVEARREPASSDRITSLATIRNVSGDVMVAAETVLRLIGPTPAAQAPRRAPGFAKGAIPELRVGPIAFSQVRRYAAASLDENPLHRDAAAARASGLAAPVVHGMFIVGQFERSLFEWRPHCQITRIFASFLQPLPVGGSIVVSGRVARATPVAGGQHLTIRLVACDDQGLLVCVGEVEGRLVSATPA
jgi:acyl dehydratase